MNTKSPDTTAPPRLPRIAERATSLFSTAVEAYVWGYPLVLMERTRKLLTQQQRRGSSPANTLRHLTKLATPREREVVKPNNDTLYSSAWLDLSAGPMVLEVPDVDRYYSFQLLDAYTNTCAYVGSRTTGTRAGRHVIVGPRWSGDVPGFDGCPVLRAPTDTVWLLGRTVVDGEEDLATAAALIKQYRLEPAQPSQREPQWWTGPAESPHTIADAGIEFYDELGIALERNPPPAAETGLLENFASAGIGPGRSPSRTTDAVTRLALEQAVAFGDQLLHARTSTRHGQSAKRADSGWSYDLDIGTYGNNYLLRAVIALHGLGALTAEEAIYASTQLDAAGQQLTGEHAYRLHFDADHLPPVDAFWSLTVYDEDNFLVANDIDRYAIGDRTPGLTYGSDGSLDLLVQHDKPGAGPSNWLPAPQGTFELTLRFYQPRQEMLDGTYKLPPIQRC